MQDPLTFDLPTPGLLEFTRAELLAPITHRVSHPGQHRQRRSDRGGDAGSRRWQWTDAGNRAVRLQRARRQRSADGPRAVTRWKSRISSGAHIRISFPLCTRTRCGRWQQTHALRANLTNEARLSFSTRRSGLEPAASGNPHATMIRATGVSYCPAARHSTPTRTTTQLGAARQPDLVARPASDDSGRRRTLAQLEWLSDRWARWRIHFRQRQSSLRSANPALSEAAVDRTRAARHSAARFQPYLSISAGFPVRPGHLQVHSAPHGELWRPLRTLRRAARTPDR